MCVNKYFDKNGKPIHKPSSNPVNAVTKTPDPTEDEEEDDVNAVGGRFPRGNRRPRPQQERRPQQYQPQRQPFKRNQQNNRPAYTPSAPPPSQKHTNSGRPTVKPQNLCYWHSNFGKEAYTCEEGCDKFVGFKSGKALAGRHT